VAAQLSAAADVGRVIGVDVATAPLPPATELHRLDLAIPRSEGDHVDAALARLVDGAHAVVHLAWQTADSATAATPAAAAGAAAEANRVALDRVLAAAAAGGVGCVVHMSSATVYGAWADNRVPLSEEVALRPNPGFAFAVGKAEAERVVSTWAEAHPEVAVAVLRPAVTVGSPQRPLYMALGATRVPGVDDGARPVQYLHVDDLASAVVLAAGRSLRGVYNVAPDSGIPESVARALAGWVATVTLPARLTRPLTAWGWYLWRRGVPPSAVAYTVHPWVVAADRLRAAGWAPAFTSEEALVATDDRPHFDDLPPGRRQQVTVALVAGSVAVAGAASVGTAVVLHRLHRLRRRAPTA